MSVKQLFILIFVIYVAGFFLHAYVVQKTVYGDGLYYVAWLRSVIIDGDINLSNDYALLGITQKPTPTGLVGNIYPIGPALAWAPAYAWTHSIARGDGVSLPYQLAIGITGVFYAIVGLLLLYRLILYFAPEYVTKLTIGGIAFATNIFFYGSLDTVNSHAVSFLLSTLLLTLWMQQKRSDVVLGMVSGLLALVRPQDALLGLLLLYKTNLRKLLLSTVGFLIVFSLQLIAWQLLYGTFRMSPYLDRGYGFNFLQPQLLAVLFSPNNGLFLWTPLTLLGVIGFFLPGFMRREYKKYFLFVMLAQLYLVASWSTWWQGASYSGRMFVSILPILAFGMAHLFTFLKRFNLKGRELFLIFVGPLSLINIILVVFFLVTH